MYYKYCTCSRLHLDNLMGKNVMELAYCGPTPVLISFDNDTAQTAKVVVSAVPTDTDVDTSND